MDSIELHYLQTPDEGETYPEHEITISQERNITYLPDLAEMLLRFVNSIGFTYVTGLTIHRDSADAVTAGEIRPYREFTKDDLDVA